jgi:hypothetical protein
MLYTPAVPAERGTECQGDILFPSDTKFSLYVSLPTEPDTSVLIPEASPLSELSERTPPLLRRLGAPRDAPGSAKEAKEETGEIKLNMRKRKGT